MVRVLEAFGEPFSNGGQEAFIMNVLQNIDMSDLCIDFYTPYYCDNDYYKSIIEEKGGKVYEVGLNFAPGSSRLDIIKPLKQLLKKEKYDVIHIHSGSISCLAYSALAASMCGVKKIIVHSHSPALKKTLKYRLVKFVTSPIMAVCPTHYFACSKEAGEWKFSKRICKKKLEIVKNGIDVNKFVFNAEIRNNIRKSLEVEDNCFLIGHVGRFSKEKNHEFLIDIMSEVIKKNSNSKLLLIGTGDEVENIKSKVNDLGLNDYVIFFGTTPNVNDYLQAMDCFVLPSLYEGLPVSTVESQAAGLKTICSNVMTSQVKITNLFEFMPLLDSAEKWADKILSYNDGYERLDVSEKICDAGFDICDTANVLKNVYI